MAPPDAIDYQAAGFWLACASFTLSLVAMISTAVLFFTHRGRVTQAAIDRVEKSNNTMHQLQEARLITIETELRHALTVKDLNVALEPIYVLIREHQAMNRGLQSELRSVKETLTTLTDCLIAKGLKD